MIRRSALLLAFALALAPRAPAAPLPTTPGTFVLEGGTVHVGDGRVLEGATVVLRDGLVAEVSATPLELPAGAVVIDCRGRHVAPGFIAADTTLGLVEIGAVRATRDETEVGELNPHVSAGTAFHPDSELLGVAMANGVLAAVVSPHGGLVPGYSDVMLLTGWTREDMTLRGRVALGVAWPSLVIDRSEGAKPPVGEQERALRDRLDSIDDLFARARADRASRDAGLGGTARIEDVRLRSMDAVLDGAPVLVTAHAVPQIRSALAWARRQGVRLVLAGARDAWRIAPEIAAAGVPVVVGNVRSLPAHDHDPYDAPFAQPAVLVRAGVRIAFTVGDAAHVRNLPDEAAMGIPWGLGAEEALQAITSWPAQIFGVADEVGTLESGKLGNVVTWSGPPLEITSRVERVFVRGAEVALEDRHSRLWRKYAARPAPRLRDAEPPR